MAEDRNIVFNVIVDEKGAITGLKSMTKGVQDIKVNSLNAKAAVDKMVNSIGAVGKGVTIKNIKLTTTELTKLEKATHQQGAASGLAAASTLELGRVISDAPYGIRGMANNVSQLASNILYGSQKIDQMTGKAVGFGGVMKGIGQSMMGPLGILIAIQAVVAAIDFFAGGMKKAENTASSLDLQLKKLNETLYVQQELTGNINSSLTNYFDSIQQHIDNLKKVKEFTDLETESKERLADINNKLIEIDQKRDFYQKNIDANATTAKRDAAQLII